MRPLPLVLTLDSGPRRHRPHPGDPHHTGGMPSERARRGTRRRFSKPSAVLDEHWTTLDGVEVFYRESRGPADSSVMLHLHGFGMSGAYLVPTAERLAGEFHTFVPDLPGFGRSGNSLQPLDVPDLAARGGGLPRRPRRRVGHRSSATRWAAP